MVQIRHSQRGQGENFLIVYADDFIAGFQYKWEAEKYYELLKERMEKFGLELEESKSRMLESGGYLAKSKQKRGESTGLETFDFLGFTFYCGRTRKGTAWMMPKTSKELYTGRVHRNAAIVSIGDTEDIRQLIVKL